MNRVIIEDPTKRKLNITSYKAPRYSGGFLTIIVSIALALLIALVIGLGV